MKRSKLFIGAALLILASINFSVANDEGSWTGWIADESCAKDYQRAASADHAGCVKSCLTRGGKLALSTKEGHFLLDFNLAFAVPHIGHEIVVNGTLDPETNTITVSSIVVP